MATDDCPVDYNIYCPICNQKLQYSYLVSAIVNVAHADYGNGCANIGKTWDAPTITLTEK